MADVCVFDEVLAPVPRYMMRLERVQRLLDSTSCDVHRFLELGPGLGDVTAHALTRYPEASGTVFEFSEDAVARLQARFRGEERLSLWSRNFLEGPLEGGFDLIMAFEVLEHIENDLLAFERIYLMLERGGVFLMSVPAYMSKWQKVDEWAGHYRRYEREELVEKLVATGFKVEEIWGYGFPVTSLLYPLRQVYYRASAKAGEPTEKIRATKQSGVARPYQKPGAAAWIARLMKPLFLLQHVARKSDLGDGWIVLAKKA